MEIKPDLPTPPAPPPERMSDIGVVLAVFGWAIAAAMVGAVALFWFMLYNMFAGPSFPEPFKTLPRDHQNMQDAVDTIGRKIFTDGMSEEELVAKLSAWGYNLDLAKSAMTAKYHISGFPCNYDFRIIWSTNNSNRTEKTASYVDINCL